MKTDTTIVAYLAAEKAITCSLWGTGVKSAPRKATQDKSQLKESEGENVPGIGEYVFRDTTSEQQKISFIEEISDLVKKTFDLVLQSLFIIWEMVSQ